MTRLGKCDFLLSLLSTRGDTEIERLQKEIERLQKEREQLITSHIEYEARIIKVMAENIRLRKQLERANDPTWPRASDVQSAPCKRCGGKGEYTVEITNHGERNEYFRERCKDCGGSGSNHETRPDSGRRDGWGKPKLAADSQKSPDPIKCKQARCVYPECICDGYV